MSFLAILNRLDVLIDRIEKMIAAITGIPAVPGVPALPPTVVVMEPKRNNRYHIFEVDLTTAHTDEKLGIGDLIKKHGVEFCNYMTIIKVDSAFTYRVNDKAASVCDAEKGDEWEDFEIVEIYYSNAALAGVGKIHVEFRVG